MRRRAALAAVDERIVLYRKKARSEWNLYAASLLVAVSGGAITPVLILWAGLPDAVKALPAALAPIATALIGHVQWRENSIRLAVTGRALESERRRFALSVQPDYGTTIDDETAVSQLVAAAEAISAAEAQGWREALSQIAAVPASHDSPSGGSH
jgi:hypothetical protein